MAPYWSLTSQPHGSGSHRRINRHSHRGNRPAARRIRFAGATARPRAPAARDPIPSQAGTADTRIQRHYAVGRRPTTPQDRGAGALLACGPSSVLSHASAAALWGITKQWPPRFELTTTVGDHRPRGLAVHRSVTLTRDQITYQYGLRVTIPERTVLDIAPAQPADRLRRIINDLRLEHRLRIRRLRELTERYPRHPGARFVIALIEEYADAAPSRSALEDTGRAFLVRHGFTGCVFNTYIGAHELDVFFPAERVNVEFDGFDVHQTRASFEVDRKRDAALLAVHRVLTVRITHRRLQQDPDAVDAELHAILAARRRDVPPDAAAGSSA